MERELDRLLRACSLDKIPGVYVIGLMSRRVSIASQQSRCFNLAAGLGRRYNKPTNIRVAIVGAGISGVTLTSALKALGFQPTLFEKQRLIISKQATSHRIVHPSINFWPLEPYVFATGFPFCNWVSDSSDDIRYQIAQDFRKLETFLQDGGYYLNYSPVTHVLKSANYSDQNRKYNIKLENGAIHEDFDIVALCTGYGEELDISHQQEYWATGPIWPKPQPSNIDEIISSKVALSGYGDGALIDLITSLYSRYSGNIIQESVTLVEKNGDFFNKICELENQLINLNDEDKLFSSKAYALYQKLTVPHSFVNFIGQNINLVNPKIVHFHLGGHPLSKHSSPIHRLIYHTLTDLVQIGLKTVPAEYVSELNSFVVEGTGDTIALDSFDYVRLRHGVNSNLFPEVDGASSVDLEQLSIKQRLLDHASSRPSYDPTEFYDSDYFCNSKDDVWGKYKECKSRITLLNEKTPGLSRIALNSDENCLDMYVDSRHKYICERYKDSYILGFNTRSMLDKGPHNEYYSNQSHCLVDINNGRFIDGDTNRGVLREIFADYARHNLILDKAVPIFLVSKTPRNTFMVATLGPMLSLDDANDELFVAYTGDLELDDLENLSVFTLVDGDLFEVGLAAADLGNRIPSSIHEIAAENVDRLKLTKRFYPKKVAFVTSPQLSGPDRWKQPTLGLNDDGDLDNLEKMRRNRKIVVKHGAKTGTTRGRVVYSSGTAKLSAHGLDGSDKLLTYEDVVTIEGLDNVPFSRPGDSGAAVYEEDSGKVIGTVLGGNDLHSIALNLPLVVRNPRLN